MQMADQIKPLTPGAIEVLGQLFLKGPTWDGNLVSKSGRTELVEAGFAEQWDGWQWLTRSGVELAVSSGKELTNRVDWLRKSGCN